MSSLADKQAITIISVAHGSVRLLIGEKRFSQLYVRENLEQLYSDIEELRHSWCSNHGNKDILWTLSRIEAWNRDLETFGYTDKIPTTTLVKISTMAIDDLLSKLRNPDRKRRVKYIFNRMNAIDQVVDSMGIAFISLDDANAILNSLYKHIDFNQGD